MNDPSNNGKVMDYVIASASVKTRSARKKTTHAIPRVAHVKNSADRWESLKGYVTGYAVWFMLAFSTTRGFEVAWTPELWQSCVLEAGQQRLKQTQPILKRWVLEMAIRNIGGPDPKACFGNVCVYFEVILSFRAFVVS